MFCLLNVMFFMVSEEMVFVSLQKDAKEPGEMNTRIQQRPPQSSIYVQSPGESFCCVHLSEGKTQSFVRELAKRI